MDTYLEDAEHFMKNGFPFDDFEFRRNIVSVEVFTNSFQFGWEALETAISKHGIPRDDPDYVDYKLLKLAVGSRFPTESVKLIIDKGSRINIESNGVTPLHIAAEVENVQIIDLLIKNGAHIESLDGKEETPLHYAVKRGNVPIINAFLRAIDNKYGPGSLEKKGLGPFHLACLRNDTAAIEELLASGAEIDQRVPENSLYWPNHTPLHLATIASHQETVDLLLKHRANVCAQNSWDQTPLHLAVILGNAKTDYMLSSMHSTQETRYMLIQELLLEAHTPDQLKLNPRDKSGFSHFHIACMVGICCSVQAFLDSGVNVNGALDADSTVYYPETPLHYAVSHWDGTILQILLEYGADSTLVNVSAESPLHYALRLKKLSFIDALLDAQIRSRKYVNPTDRNGVSHLHMACLRNRAVLVREFARNGVLINTPIKYSHMFWPNYTSLHLAVIHKADETVDVLLEEGANLLAQELKLYWMPLHFAAHYAFVEIVRKLVTAGANRHARDLKGRMPFQVALETKQVELLRMYNTIYGTDPAEPPYGNRNLFCRLNRLETIEILLEGVNNICHSICRYRQATIHLLAEKLSSEEAELDPAEEACLYGAYCNVIKKMKEAGYYLHTKDGNGRTVLHLMFQKRNKVGASALINSGASLEIPDNFGYIPLDYCDQPELFMPET